MINQTALELHLQDQIMLSGKIYILKWQCWFLSINLLICAEIIKTKLIYQRV